MEKLYNYLFHFNYTTNLWAAFKREDKNKYFNQGGDRSKEHGIIYSKNITDITDFIINKKK